MNLSVDYTLYNLDHKTIPFNLPSAERDSRNSVDRETDAHALRLSAYPPANFFPHYPKLNGFCSHYVSPSVPPMVYSANSYGALIASEMDPNQLNINQPEMNSIKQIARDCDRFGRPPLVCQESYTDEYGPHQLYTDYGTIALSAGDKSEWEACAFRRITTIAQPEMCNRIGGSYSASFSLPTECSGYSPDNNTAAYNSVQTFSQSPVQTRSSCETSLGKTCELAQPDPDKHVLDVKSDEQEKRFAVMNTQHNTEAHFTIDVSQGEHEFVLFDLERRKTDMQETHHCSSSTHRQSHLKWEPDISSYHSFPPKNVTAESTTDESALCSVGFIVNVCSSLESPAPSSQLKLNRVNRTSRTQIEQTVHLSPAATAFDCNGYLVRSEQCGANEETKREEVGPFSCRTNTNERLGKTISSASELNCSGLKQSVAGAKSSPSMTNTPVTRCPLPFKWMQIKRQQPRPLGKFVNIPREFFNP